MMTNSLIDPSSPALSHTHTHHNKPTGGREVPQGAAQEGQGHGREGDQEGPGGASHGRGGWVLYISVCICRVLSFKNTPARYILITPSSHPPTHITGQGGGPTLPGGGLRGQGAGAGQGRGGGRGHFGERQGYVCPYVGWLDVCRWMDGWMDGWMVGGAYAYRTPHPTTHHPARTTPLKPISKHKRDQARRKTCARSWRRRRRSWRPRKRLP